MDRGIVWAAIALALAATGCSNPFAAQQQSQDQSCVEKFNSVGLRDWVERMASGQRQGSVTLAYGIDLPFENAKKIENALAQLPGNNQQVSFDGSGGVHVRISGAEPSIEFTVTADSDGGSEQSSRVLIAETLCSAAQAVDGKLTDISVQTTDYSFDDGKPRLQPIP